MKDEKTHSTSASILVASIMAGWAQHAALHPLDTLKVRLQYARNATEQSAVLWQNIAALELPRGIREIKHPKFDWLYKFPIFADIRASVQMFRQTPQPIRNLYSGLGASLLAVVPAALVYMPSYELSRHILARQRHSREASYISIPPTLHAPVAAMATGLVCAVARAPLSVIKARVQLGLYNSSASGARAAWSTLRRQGAVSMVRDAYAGFGATATLDVATAVVLFVSLDALRALAHSRNSGELSQHYIDKSTSSGNTSSSSSSSISSSSSSSSSTRHGLSSSENASIGFFASALATVATEPIDVIRTRLMAQEKVSSGSHHLPESPSSVSGTPRATSAEAPGPSTDIKHGKAPASAPKNFGYRGLFDGLRRAVSSEGISSLYRGLLPRLLLKSLGGSIWYTTYSWVKAEMERKSF